MTRFYALGALASAGLLAGSFALVDAGGEPNRRRLELPDAGKFQAGSFPCTVASVTDGDTFRCAERGADGREIRVRLAGVAARERDGACLLGHPCPAASAEASTAALERLALGQALTCRPEGSTYGRVAAFCVRSTGEDLSCLMVASGLVAKWPRYWRGHRC